MSRVGVVLGSAVVVLGAATVFVLAGSGKPMPRAGDLAPLFEAVDQHGATIRLEQFREKAEVVLYFYPKDGTPGCTAQACSLRDGYQAIEKAGAVVIGVSADSAESHEGFAKKHSLPFSILPDPKHKIIGQYGVGMPLIGISKRVTFLIGKDGVIRTVIPEARTSDHDRQVLDLLRRKE